MPDDAEKSKPAPDNPKEKPPDPIDQMLQELKDKDLSHAQIVGKLETLKVQVEGAKKGALDVKKIPTLKESVRTEVNTGVEVEELDEKQKDAFFADLEARITEIENIAKTSAAVATSEKKSFFSKEGFSEGLNSSLKKIGEFASAMGAVRDQIKESIASSIGAHIETLKPFIGEPFAKTLEAFIGQDRIHLSKTLAAADIKLPMESFIHARKSIENARKATGAQSRGWNAERMSFFVVQKLKSAGITGKEEKPNIEQKINAAVSALSSEILKTPSSGSNLNFVDTPPAPENKLSTAVAGKQVIIQSDGGMTVAGQKWKLEKSGQKVAVRHAEFVEGSLKIQDAGSYETMVLKNNLSDIIADLADPDRLQPIKPVDSSGKVIVEFIRS